MPTDIPHAWQKRILPSEVNTSYNSNTQWCKWGTLGFHYLGAFTKSWEEQPLDLPCLFVHMEQFSSYWTDFSEIWYLSIFLKICHEDSSFFKIW
jgi:hypothetical protein